MNKVIIFTFSLLLGLIYMAVDIKMTPSKKENLDNFAKLSQLYTLQIEKNDFVYKVRNE